MTTTSLQKRWNGHLRDYNEGKQITIYKYMREYGVDRFKIEVIKQYDIVDSKHLKVYETLWINRLRCVNKNVSFSPIRIITKRF